MIFRISLVLALSSCASGFSSPGSTSLERANYLFQAGIGFYEAQQYPQSLETFYQAWQIDKKNLVYKMHYALALDAVGQHEKALATLEETCKASKNYPECDNNLSAFFIKAKRYEEAIAWADKALSVPTYKSPDVAYRNKGLGLYFLQRYAESKDAFQRSLRAAGRNASCLTRMYLSRSLLAQAEFEEAVREARLARSMCETRTEAHFWLAYSLFRTARINEASAVLLELRDLSRDPETRSRAENMLSQLNREEALAEPAIIL
jgi:type IV pilus assembly protein PilF